MSVSKPRPEQAWRLRIPIGDAPQRGRNRHELQAETLEPEVFGRLANLMKRWRKPGRAKVNPRLASPRPLTSCRCVAEARMHFDQAVVLYDLEEHRRLALRFGQDVRMAILSLRSLALWILGYRDAACADADGAIREARIIGQAATDDVCTVLGIFDVRLL